MHKLLLFGILGCLVALLTPLSVSTEADQKWMFCFIVLLQPLTVTQTVVVSMSEKTYCCNVCMSKNVGITRLLSHYKFHQNVSNAMFYCPLENCSQMSGIFSSLKVHVTRNHSYQPHTDNSVPTASIDTGHIHVSNTCLRAGCLHQSLTSFEDLKNHLKQHLLKREEITCPFDDCFSKFTDKSSFPSHLSRKHSGLGVTYVNAVLPVKQADAQPVDQELDLEVDQNQEDMFDNIGEFS